MKQTTLDLNGPILSFIEQPSSASVCDSGTATFTGVATASFPSQTPTNPASNTGTLSYQWYANDYGALTDGSFLGATISGSGTTTLTITGADSPTISGLEVSLGVDYVPSAYSQPVGSAVTVGTGRSTGNALNEILFSDVATLTVYPTISITTQPTEQTAAQARTATFNVAATSTDATQGDLSYQWTANGTNLVNGDTTINGGIVDTASGATSTQLILSSRTVGIQTISCTVSHPTSCLSPIFTNTVNFNVVSARAILNYEEYNDSAATMIRTGSQNIFDGPLTLTADPNNTTRAAVIYAPEKGMRVRITLAASAGQTRGGQGGEGGVSVFEYDLLQNVEYLFKLGSTSAPTGGTNGGGGGAFFYNRARLVAACGGGGGGGSNARGGFGGGMRVGGENGQGRSGGRGGQRFNDGELPVYGFFPGGAYCCSVNWSAPTAGRLSSCTIGNYYRDRVSPCSDLGVQRFVGSDGPVLQSSALILRGYKSGLAHRNNGGNGSGAEGGGGAGAYGGDAGGGSGSGGGGASGYSNGEPLIISTQLGGNTNTNAYTIIELVS